MRCLPHFHLARPFFFHLLKCFRVGAAPCPSGNFVSLDIIRRLSSERWLPCSGDYISFKGSRLGWCGMERPVRMMNAAVDMLDFPDEKFFLQFPSVTEMLTCCKYSDGTARQPSTLSFFVDDGACKVALADREMEQSLYRTGCSFTEALEAVEEALTTKGKDDWRAWGKKKK